MRRVPFQIVRSPVVQINSFPVGVLAWVKCAAVYVELVGEYQYLLFAVKAGAMVRGLGGVGVYHAKVDCVFGDLSSGVDAT